MKENTYNISQKQLDDINYFQRMFQLNAETIQELCNSEKDDVVYGFELGRMHSHLKKCYMEMLELEGDIREQNDYTEESAASRYAHQIEK